MNLFDKLVRDALKNQSQLASLRVVVEKELLHHDVLREMSGAGFLDRLTFIGGTCLRVCYGSSRLSEDLDFTGGKEFKRDWLRDLAEVLVATLEAKYNLAVTVDEPQKESGNVDTWKLKITTRPERKMSPAQRINIDISMVPSYEPRPMMLRNSYGVDMGTSGLIINAESREEILADKFIALALRPNRLKNRDLWDIAWLKQQGLTVPLPLIQKKAADRQITFHDFAERLHARRLLIEQAPAVRGDFLHEMRRFLPKHSVIDSLEKPEYWQYLSNLIGMECERIVQLN